MSYDTHKTWFFQTVGRNIHLWQYVESNATDTLAGIRISLPDEYYGVMARYSIGDEITKKEAKQNAKKYKKKGGGKEPPVGFSMLKGNHIIDFD